MKKKLSILLCTCVVLSLPQVTTYAQSVETPVAKVDTATADSSSNQKEPDVNTLTDITSYVKSKITIPKALTEFEYLYNSSSSTSTPEWNLTWTTKDNSERMSVVCDSNKNILTYRYSPDTKSRQNKPVYLKKELKTKADDFIKKTNSSIYNSLEYIGTANTDIYSGTYSYCYERMENGVPMPDNTVEVEINYETGKVISLNTNWLYHITIPAKNVKLTKEEAAKKIGSNLTMELEYHSPYRDETTKDSGKAYLVYRPDKSYLSIDANTGKVYLSRNEWLEGNNSSANEEKSEDSSGLRSAKKEAASKELTKEEIASIRKLKNLISQKAAIQAIKDEKSLLLDENCTVITANLKLITNQYLEKNKDYVWDISFSDSRDIQPENKEIYSSYARAVVDANNGKILSYYAKTPEYYNMTEDKWDSVSVKYNLKECLPIFESFAKKQIPEYFNSAKLTESDNDYIAAYKNDKPIYGGYTYSYTRFNESVPYSSNGFSGSVDGVTGKIYQFNTNWDENATFQSTKSVMSPSEAFDHYISKDGYELIYEINSIHNTKEGTQQNEVRLVYRGDISPSTISPFSGKQLDYNGKVVTGESSTFTYHDIDSSKNKRAILLLADLGIGFDGGKFSPSNKMTKGELETMLSSLNYSSKKLTTKESAEKITRTDAVKRFITYADLDKVANLKNIYKTNFKDQNKIAASDLGYVALAKGLGIIYGDTFRGMDILTREEAAQMIINLLKSDY